MEKYLDKTEITAKNFGVVVGKLMEIAETLTLSGVERKKMVIDALDKKLENNEYRVLLLPVADSIIETIINASLNNLNINKDNELNVKNVILSKLEKTMNISKAVETVVNELNKLGKLTNMEKKKYAMELILSFKPEIRDTELVDSLIEATVKLVKKVKKRCL
jgi:polyhydroxyalkanoate synthesis regulator phasin